ncbi:hypothetical protein Peur_048082 [Populus x canadensis]
MERETIAKAFLEYKAPSFSLRQASNSRNLDLDVDGEIGFVVFTVNWRELRFHVGVSRIGDMTLKGMELLIMCFLCDWSFRLRKDQSLRLQALVKDLRLLVEKEGFDTLSNEESFNKLKLDSSGSLLSC